jgi:hypothetical protein
MGAGRDGGVGNHLDRFAEAARSLECSEDEVRFNETLGKIVKQKPVDKMLEPQTKKPGQ